MKSAINLREISQHINKNTQQTLSSTLRRSPGITNAKPVTLNLCAINVLLPIFTVE